MGISYNKSSISISYFNHDLLRQYLNLLFLPRKISVHYCGCWQNLLVSIYFDAIFNPLSMTFVNVSLDYNQ